MGGAGPRCLSSFEDALAMNGVFYPIVPYPKPRMSQRDRWKKRPCVLRYRAFCDEVRLRRVVLPIPSKVTFLIGMPRSWAQAKRDEFDGQLHEAERSDVDNLLKALLDGLYRKDGHVASVWPEKRWTSGQPGILIQPLDGVAHE